LRPTQIFEFNSMAPVPAIADLVADIVVRRRCS
jgi:hypothetical protein